MQLHKPLLGPAALYLPTERPWERAGNVANVLAEFATIHQVASCTSSNSPEAGCNSTRVAAGCSWGQRQALQALSRSVTAAGGQSLTECTPARLSGSRSRQPAWRTSTRWQPTRSSCSMTRWDASLGTQQLQHGHVHQCVVSACCTAPDTAWVQQSRCAWPWAPIVRMDT